MYKKGPLRHEIDQQRRGGSLNPEQNTSETEVKNHIFFVKICLEFGYFLSFMLAQHALPLSCREDNAFGADEALPLFILIIISSLAAFMSSRRQPSGVDLYVLFS